MLIIGHRALSGVVNRHINLRGDGHRLRTVAALHSEIRLLAELLVLGLLGGLAAGPARNQPPQSREFILTYAPAGIAQISPLLERKPAPRPRKHADTHTTVTRSCNYYATVVVTTYAV